MFMLMLMLIHQMILQHLVDAMPCYAKPIAYTYSMRFVICSLMAHALFGHYDPDALKSES